MAITVTVGSFRAETRRWTFPRRRREYLFEFPVIVAEGFPPPAPQPTPDRWAPVTQAMYQAMPRLQACLGEESPAQVALVVTSAADGSVIGATVDRSLEDTRAGACLRAVARTLQLPPAPVQTTWPLVLDRAGGGTVAHE